MLMIGIRQFFTCQNFPNPDSSKFSTVKILRHTVFQIFHLSRLSQLTTVTNVSAVTIVTTITTIGTEQLRSLII